MLKKSLFATVFTMSSLFVLPTNIAQAKVVTYNIEPEHAQVLWSVREHISLMNGGFKLVMGQVKLDNEHPENSSVQAKIYTNTVYYPQSRYLTRHLKTSDFLAVKQFPYATFKSTKVIVTGKNTADVIGDMVLKGKKSQITLHALLEGRGKTAYGGTVYNDSFDADGKPEGECGCGGLFGGTKYDGVGLHVTGDIPMFAKGYNFSTVHLDMFIEAYDGLDVKKDMALQRKIYKDKYGKKSKH